MSSPPPDSPHRSYNPFRHLIHSILSYNGNIMLAAIISLLVVILFVLLLHVYAKWFLAQAVHRSRSSVSVSHVSGPDRFHHSHTFTVETALSPTQTKGLDPSVIASIPLLVYKSDEYKHGLECVICLSLFENEDVGRMLPKCGHAFHVECIDMWLHSQSNCPICRAPVVCENKIEDIDSFPNGGVPINELRGERSEVMAGDELGVINSYSALEIMIEVPPNSENENVAVCDSTSACSNSSSSSSSQAPSSLGESLKRMLSRNRSERKVHPSFIVTDSPEA